MRNKFIDGYRDEIIKGVTESDWIVLRLCMEIVYSGHFNGNNFPEGDRAVNFMRRKYGVYVFDAAISKLKEERNEPYIRKS